MVKFISSISSVSKEPVVALEFIGKSSRFDCAFDVFELVEDAVPDKGLDEVPDSDSSDPVWELKLCGPIESTS
jgi:hypothetical protein